jgi:hypothetical protein
VFIRTKESHLAVNEQDGRTARTTKARTMNNSHIFTRSLSLIFTGITAATLFLMAFAPSASLFAG